MATKTQEHSNAAAYQRSLKELPPANPTIPREKYDIVIIGAGPAGLFSGAALARFGWDVLIVDNRKEPTIAGRAGISLSLSPRPRCTLWLLDFVIRRGN
jgi:heterodisulfide reductase subunit A-like polyferredoxin